MPRRKNPHFPIQFSLAFSIRNDSDAATHHVSEMPRRKGRAPAPRINPSIDPVNDELTDVERDARTGMQWAESAMAYCDWQAGVAWRRWPLTHSRVKDHWRRVRRIIFEAVHSTTQEECTCQACERERRTDREVEALRIGITEPRLRELEQYAEELTRERKQAEWSRMLASRYAPPVEHYAGDGWSKARRDAQTAKQAARIAGELPPKKVAVSERIYDARKQAM